MSPYEFILFYNMFHQVQSPNPFHLYNHFSIGGFLSEAGWFVESSKVLTQCRDLCFQQPENIDSWKKTLECCHK